MVSIMKYLFKNVYYEVESHSRDQLEKDFGEFPPKGLVVDESLLKPFRIAFGNGAGIGIYYIGQMRGVLNIANANPKWKIAKENLRELKNSFEEANIVMKIIFASIVALMSPFLLIFAILQLTLILKKLISSVRNKSEPDVGGLYLGFPGYEDKLAVRTEQTDSTDKFFEASIAHEHIHLLQTKRFHKASEDFFIDTEMARIDGLLKDNLAAHPYVEYLFKSKEVEARLHELVLSFYRANHCLPDTVEGLVGLVSLNEEHKGKFLKQLEMDEAYFLEQHGYHPYATRCPTIARQFRSILKAIETDQNVLRFGLEVLPVMYANLLDYYGDPAAAMRFRQQIQGPGMFERLYG